MEQAREPAGLPAKDFPFLLDNPRAWRTYLGGRGLDELHGNPGGENGHFPEEWVLSTVAARNAGREEFAEEGMGHLRGSSLTLKSILEADPEGYLGRGHAEPSLGVLVKLIDSAERLTVQVHPDKPAALRLFGSPYGKTECWHILGGQAVGGQEPCIYLGFKPEVTRPVWEELFRRQDIPGMLAAMQRYPVRPGDTILIEGGMPHAIGAGCFLVEIQEPTDYTIRVERTTPSGFAVADSMCHQGLGFERMFDCFHYEPMAREEISRRWFIRPQPLQSTPGGRITRLIGYGSTPLFCLDELLVTGKLALPAGEDFYGLYVLEGSGRLAAGEKALALHKTDQVFVPWQAGSLTLECTESAPLRLLRFYGPRRPNSAA